SDEEHDDELDKWEQEQIRKGISSYRQEQIASAYYYSSQTQNVYGISGYNYAVLSDQYSSSAHGYIENNDAEQSSSEVIGPQPMDLDIELHNDEQRLPKIGGGNVNRLAKQFDLNTIRLRIKEKFDEKQNVERSITSDLEQKRRYIEENIVMLDQLKKCQPNLEKKLQLFQELRSYVRDLLDCLDEKLPIIEKLEEASLTLFSNRTNFIVKRRRQDVKDQFDDISLLSVGKSLDNNDAERMMRSSERDARKARRRQAREKTLAGLGHHEGMSSDDEEAPSRTANFTAELARMESCEYFKVKLTGFEMSYISNFIDFISIHCCPRKISQEIPSIWSDVEEDYCSIKKIIDRFYDWKNIDRASYEKSYADMCLPKLLGPIIRSELITWNLFQVECPLSLEYFEWFKLCMNADKSLENSVNHEPQATAKNSDTNNDVRLSASQVWDPVSTFQSERFSTLIKISVCSLLQDKNNSKLKDLFDAIYKRIKTALDEDLFTPIYSKEVIENKATGAAIFLEKQFWLALKILKNIGFWDNVMTSKIVEELSLDGVINRHVVLNLQCSIYADVGILTKLKSLTNLITVSQWFQTLKKIDGVNQLEPLYKIMRRICEQIHDSKSMNSNEI
uniref:GCF C-terminal domain-containing protein n=1 Tax=Romanomermis culicivorax TaxID=13658 RepID=A0A915KWR8_ROMCU